MNKKTINDCRRRLKECIRIVERIQPEEERFEKGKKQMKENILKLFEQWSVCITNDTDSADIYELKEKMERLK